MPDTLSEENVRHIAKLAKIEISEKEVATFKDQLSAILDFVDVLNEINTKGVKTLDQTTGLTNIFREDELNPSLTKEEALANAPNRYQNYFRTKSVLEEKNQ